MSTPKLATRQMSSVHEAIKSNRLAYVAITTDSGFSIGVAIENESGYTPLNYHSVDTYEEATKWAALCNQRLGITQERADQIQISSFR